VAKRTVLKQQRPATDSRPVAGFPFWVGSRLNPVTRQEATKQSGTKNRKPDCKALLFEPNQAKTTGKKILGKNIGEKKAFRFPFFVQDFFVCRFGTMAWPM
jgi:hypothetical protein